MSFPKKSLQRDCPYLGQTISARECGSHRGSSYACPADCPHFPFAPATYDQHLAIESRLIRKTYELAARTLPAAVLRSLTRAVAGSAGSSGEVTANHARITWAFFWDRDETGRTPGERWLESPFATLNNDERFLLARMNLIRPVLLEVHRILDGQTLEGVDLLDGTPLRVVDRAFAGGAVRYQTLLIWCYPLPYYQRTGGTAHPIPEVGRLEPQEVLREIIRHLGGPTDPSGERTWLAEHFVRTSEALAAVELARLEDSMARIDADFVQTDYLIGDPSRLASRLVEEADIEEEPLARERAAEGFSRSFVVLEAADSGNPAVAGATVLGTVLLGENRVRIEAMTRSEHGKLRTRFEQVADGSARFVRELVEDLTAKVLQKQKLDFDRSLVPPRLREKPKELGLSSRRITGSAPAGSPSALFHLQYDGFLDQPLLWLDGLTPREASALQDMRPRLVGLMKGHIRKCDARRRKSGLEEDLNPLLEDLGLHELVSEPVPLGEPGPETATTSDILTKSPCVS